MPTIKEVADLANVSVGTVSHVINGSVPVSEALRAKVQAAIEELDYHPNYVARSLKTRRTRTLGIVVPDMTISFFPQIIQGAEAAARKRNYSLIAVNSDESGSRQKELVSLLRSQRVEGILLVIASTPVPVSEISRVLDAGIPIVCLDRIPDKVSVDSVSVQDTEAAEAGVEHLISQGHRRIAIATGPLTLKNERSRLNGYKRALRKAGIELQQELIWESDLHPENVSALCIPKVSDPALRPDAVFATNGPTGIGVLRAFRKCGLRTPADIGFLTFDELTLDDLFSPSITTIVQPAYEIGFTGAEMLLNRIENGAASAEPSAVRLPTILKIRDSSQASSKVSRAT